jgi:hypothetical protein
MELIRKVVEKQEWIDRNQRRYPELPPPLWFGEIEGASETTAWRAIFNRPYWSRVWVVQECITSQDLVIACGNRYMDFRLSLVRLYHWETGYDGAHAHINRRISWQSTRQSLLEVLSEFSTMEYGNPRDRVYGLLGLVSHDEQVTIDYSRPPRQVF